MSTQGYLSSHCENPVCHQLSSTAADIGSSDCADELNLLDHDDGQISRKRIIDSILPEGDSRLCALMIDLDGSSEGLRNGRAGSRKSAVDDRHGFSISAPKISVSE